MNYKQSAAGTPPAAEALWNNRKLKYGNCAAVIVEGCLATMSSDNLPHQMQPQNVGRVWVGAGIG